MSQKKLIKILKFLFKLLVSVLALIYVMTVIKLFFGEVVIPILYMMEKHQ